MDLMHRMGTALLIHMPQISSISIRKKHTNNQAIIPKDRNDTTPLSFLLLMLVSVSAKYTAVPTWNKGKIRKSKHWYPPERFFRRHPSSWTETHSIMSIVLTKEKIANGPTVAILFWKVISWLLVRVVDTSHKSKIVSSAHESSPSFTKLSDVLIILLSFSLHIFVEGALQVVETGNW